MLSRLIGPVVLLWKYWLPDVPYNAKTTLLND